MRQRSFLKNDDLIIFAEFNGKDLLPDSPYKNQIGDPFYLFSYIQVTIATCLWVIF